MEDLKPGWNSEMGQGLHKNIIHQVRASKDIKQGTDLAEMEKPEVAVKSNNKRNSYENEGN